MKRHLNWMILLGLLLFSLTGNAQSNKVMKVLWVGNRFTFYNANFFNVVALFGNWFL